MLCQVNLQCIQSKVIAINAINQESSYLGTLIMNRLYWDVIPSLI